MALAGLVLALGLGTGKVAARQGQGSPGMDSQQIQQQIQRRAMEFQRDRIVPTNRPVLRVSGLTNQPADLLVWMADLGTNDYRAPQFTGLPYTDPYVIERGGGKGGIRLMSEGGRPVKEFVIPRREIKAIVRLHYDMDVVDWTDVVISRSKVTLIHTGYANAGVFNPSEVYVFPRSRNCFDYLKVIEANAWAVDDLKLLYPALLFYETGNRPDRPND